MFKTDLVLTSRQLSTLTEAEKELETIDARLASVENNFCEERLQFAIERSERNSWFRTDITEQELIAAGNYELENPISYVDKTKIALPIEVQKFSYLLRTSIVKLKDLYSMHDTYFAAAADTITITAEEARLIHWRVQELENSKKPKGPQRSNSGKHPSVS